MASESIINTLLQQEFARRNQPNQSLAQMLQIMEGIAKGIQIYDAAKSIPAKFGTGPTTQTSVTPGVSATPGVPGNSPAPFTLPGIGPSYGTEGLIAPEPRTMPGIGPSLPAVPGTPAIPPVTTSNTIPGQLGSVDADMLKSLQGFQGAGVDAIFNQTLKKHGLEGQISPAPSYVMTGMSATGQPELAQVPKNTKILPETTVPATYFDEKTKKYYQYDKQGNRIQVTNVPKSGVKEIEDTSSASGKSQQDKLDRILASVEDDARSSANTAVDDIKKITSPGLYEETYQKEFNRILDSRVGKDFPVELVEQARLQRFGTRGNIGDAIRYAKKNKETVDKIKVRMMALKGAGQLATAQDQLKIKKDLLQRGVPEALADQMISEALLLP